MINKILDAAYKIMIGLGVAYIFYLAATHIMNMPLVTFSHSTKQCISVYPSDEWTCENLPEQYELVWGK